MEVKINKEIRNYTESMFFGLSLRQFLFSLCACISAVIVYFLSKPYFGNEIISWLCIMSVIPFALFGFVKYNGMSMEKFLLVWFKSEILTPKVLKFHSENAYAKLMSIKNTKGKRKND